MPILSIDGKIVTVDGKPITTPQPVPEEATLTINVDGYSSEQYGGIAYVDVDGNVQGTMSNATDKRQFPYTIKLLKGSCVFLGASSWGGMPALKNKIGCDSTPGSMTFLIYVSDTQSSVTV